MNATFGKDENGLSGITVKSSSQRSERIADVQFVSNRNVRQATVRFAFGLIYIH